jgi:hypothetical protein
MKTYKIDDFKGGWFIGNFEPTLLKTKDFEICYKRHTKDEVWPSHYHAVATEYNCLVSGSMSVNGQLLQPGDIFVIEPNEIAVPRFLENCDIIVVKTPSIVGDKYEVSQGVA